MGQSLKLEDQALFIHFYTVIIIALNLCYDSYVSAYFSNNKIIDWRNLFFIWSTSDFVDWEQTDLKVF